ncbi:YxeA family protein [Isobaculum melis]|uniref:YxeA family protein n=1 Tax=Isobaculum melis TaxID=142588 RepID=A0A1H9QJK2_9LACT|nr:YxeA family protein [Isobaculum melis]SER60029.1 conserved hypothetical protein TIGR01655 [Isobaculum melis]
MKKIGWLIAIVVIVVGGYFTYKMLTEDDYYTKITIVGEKEIKTTDRGEKIVDYLYELPGFNKDGKEKKLSFYGNKEVPLREEAYLKLKVNGGKGVVSWEEVPKNEVPEKALKELE